MSPYHVTFLSMASSDILVLKIISLTVSVMLPRDFSLF